MKFGVGHRRVVDQHADTGPRLWKSQKKLEEKFERTKPKTVKEARQQWEAMQKTPDHDALLKMYKHAGVEPIKLAKYIIPTLSLGEKI
jgi:small subunit ribosomal protein S10